MGSVQTVGEVGLADFKSRRFVRCGSEVPAVSVVVQSRLAGISKGAGFLCCGTGCLLMFPVGIYPVSVSLVRFQVIIIISIPLGFSAELPVSIYLIGLDTFQWLPVDFYVVDLSFSVEFERDGSDGPIVRSGESRIDCGMAGGFLPGQGMGRHGMSVETQ